MPCRFSLCLLANSFTNFAKTIHQMKAHEANESTGDRLRESHHIIYIRFSLFRNSNVRLIAFLMHSVLFIGFYDHFS